MAKLEQEIVEMLRERMYDRKIENVPAHIDKLKTAFNTFNNQDNFIKGDIVVWKENMKNKLRPAENEPCIVMEVLKIPLYDTTKETGNSLFNEPLDLVLGIIDKDGDFIIRYYDKRRFTLMKDSSSNS